MDKLSQLRGSKGKKVLDVLENPLYAPIYPLSYHSHLASPSSLITIANFYIFFDTID